MIEDFDGPDPVSNRRGHMLVLSVLLVVGVIAGYAAVSSPELRGPFATPRPVPSLATAARFTPAPFASVEPASVGVPRAVCTVPGSGSNATIFINGQPVIISPPIALSSTPECPVIWGRPPSPMPYYRVSH